MQGFLRRREFYELIVKAIFNTQQCRRNFEDHIFAGSATSFDDALQTFDLTDNIAAQLAQAQHAERVTDFLQQF